MHLPLKISAQVIRAFKNLVESRMHIKNFKSYGFQSFSPFLNILAELYIYVSEISS